MPSLTDTDLDRLRRNLFADGPDAKLKHSKFWVLLILAGCIAAAGVVADSTATVIGAMIVAPLMTPIMGTVLAIVTADRRNLAHSLAMVFGGSVVVIGLGYGLGLIAPIAVVADTSTQVAARIQPRIVDLAAALATGAAGAFAQCREDVSDAVPGVAIAISLVPPLAVVGLTLEGGEPSQAVGALLLFLTNVAAILLTGIGVMALFGAHRIAQLEAGETIDRRKAVGVVIVLTLLIAIPLATTTATLTASTFQQRDITRVATEWAGAVGWRVVAVEPRSDRVAVFASGPLPAPDPAKLRALLDAAGLETVAVTALLSPEDRIELPVR